MQRCFEVLPPPGARFLNKRAVRIKVVIPSTNRALKPWLPWARKRLAPDWLETLTHTGGGKTKAETWFLYFGTVEPSRFSAVEVRTDAGAYEPLALVPG